MDAVVIRFTTAIFDVSRERLNPINPIHGETLLLWLARRLEGRVAVPEPQAEDWGWYADVQWSGRAYTLGASATSEGDEDGADRSPKNASREWILQIVKHRSIKERLLGREKMTPDDPCAVALHRLLESEPAFSNVQRD